MTEQVPAAAAAIDQIGDDLQQPASSAPAAGRRWRAGALYTDEQPAGNAPAGQLAGVHLSPGQADPRRALTLGTGSANSEQPYASHPFNDRVDAGQYVQAPPERNRAGSTSFDERRPARMQHAFVIRPFDQAIAQHPGAVDKIEQPSPLAAQPLAYDAPSAGARPSWAGGSGSTRVPGVGIQRNTFRVLPAPWDELAVVGAPDAGQLADPGAAAVSSRRSRGWRL